MFSKLYQRVFSSVLKALNYDFSPKASLYFDWLKQPVGWVVCAILASILVGLFVGPQGFVLAGAFAALLVLGVIWPWLCMKGLSCELKFDQSQSVEGEPTNVSLEIINRLPFPTFGLIIQGKFLQDIVHEDDVIAVSLKQVPGWSVSKFEWPLVPNRRGELPVEIPSLATGFPFGLYQISKAIHIVGSKIVWPKTDPMETPVETVGTQFAIDAAAGRQAGNDGETIGVRDYRYGDPVRNIHWSHTARHNRLILRERQSVTQTPMRVVVDLTPEHHSGIGSQDTYENAIRLAASVCCELHRHQFQIDLICLGLAAELPKTANNHRGLNPLLDFLARLPVSDDQLSFAIFKDGTVEAAIQNKRAFTFLIHTSRFTPDVDASFVKCYCVDANSGVDSEFESTQSLHGPSVFVSPESSNLGAAYVPT